MAEKGHVIPSSVLKTLTSAISRATVAARLGQSFGGSRDVYKEFGWKKELAFDDYLMRYRRDGLARRIITMPVEATWTLVPYIEELDTSKKDIGHTDFEDAMESMAQRLGLWRHFERVDRLARIGQYAGLVIGVNDREDLDKPLVRGKIAYVKAYSERYLKINEVDDDVHSPRFGLPKSYWLTTGAATQGGASRSTSPTVHHTRVIHVAENADEAEALGTPALESTFNLLQSLEQTIGGSSEMFWKGALAGRAIVADKEASWGPDDQEALQSEVEEFYHGLRRFMRLQGAEVKDLTPQIGDPTPVVDALLDIIAGAVGIPKRLLKGSEMGELASSQDHTSFASLIRHRQTTHAEPVILRAFVDKAIALKAVPPPVTGGYKVDWPDPHAPSDEDKAKLGLLRAQAMRAAFGVHTEAMVPAQQFLEDLGFDVKEEDLADLDDLNEEELPEETEDVREPRDEDEGTEDEPAATGQPGTADSSSGPDDDADGTPAV